MVKKGSERPGVSGEEASLAKAEKERRASLIARYIETRVVGVNETVSKKEQEEIAEFYKKLSPRERADTLRAKLVAYALDKKQEEIVSDINLIAEIKVLFEDPETQKLFLEFYGEMRVDTKELRASELGALWKNLKEEIREKEAVFQAFERDLHLGAIKGEGKVSSARSRVARLAENIAALLTRKKDIENLNVKGFPAVVENTDVVASFSYETFKEYKDQLDAGFVKLPSRKKIHQEIISALLNHRWPVLIGEAGSGKSDQADAAALELTGHLPTEIECESTTGEIQLVSDDAIDAVGGSYKKYGALMAAFTGFEDSRQKEPAFRTGRIARFDESGRLGPKAYSIIKKARQKRPGDDFYGRLVLPGAAAIWTSNPVGPRYPDRHAPDPAMRRELAEIPVPYPDMSPESPELYEFAIPALFDKNHDIAVAKEEIMPAYEKHEIPEDKREKLLDGSIVVAKDMLVENMADPRHGALWRFMAAVKALQDSFVYGNTETGKYPDTLLRYKEDTQGNIEVVETGGDPLTLTTSTVTLGELRSWMEGWNERREKQDVQFRVDTLTEWLDFKITTYLKQADNTDKEKIKAIFKYFHFLEGKAAGPELRSTKPLTPKEIGYLSPRVPRPLYVERPKVEEKIQPKAEKSKPAEKYETREVLLDTHERVLMKTSADFTGGEDASINISLGEPFIIDGQRFIVAGQAADVKSSYAGKLIGKFVGEELYRMFTPEEVDQGILASFHESSQHDLVDLEEDTQHLQEVFISPTKPKKKRFFGR